MKNDAFSLVEVLVVIALTASLAALLFPVFATVREKSRSTACISNIRQLGVAIAMYAQDSDELYPHGTDVLSRHVALLDANPYQNLAYKDIPLLQDILQPYCKNRDLWRCPSDTGFDGPDAHPTGPMLLSAHPSAFEAFGSSYEYNTDLALHHKLYATSGYRNGAEVGPGELLVLGDLYGAWHGEPDTEYTDHEAFNELMGDGHMKRITSIQRAQASQISLDK